MRGIVQVKAHLVQIVVTQMARPLDIQVGPAKADARIRTGDPFITSEVLYQLSYVGEAGIVGASAVAPSSDRIVCARASGSPSSRLAVTRITR